MAAQEWLWPGEQRAATGVRARSAAAGVAVRQGVPCLLVLVALTVFLANNRFLESTDTIGNELLPLSILNQGTLTFDQYYAPPNPDGTYPTGEQALADGSIPESAQYRVMPELPSKSVPWWFVRRDGHVISLYPVAPGLLNTPVFLLARAAGVDLASNVVFLTHITTSVISALTVLAMYLCLIQACSWRRTAVFLTVAFAFGTAIWSANSRSLYQHGAATLFITVALASLLTRRERWVAVSGLFLGLAIACRPTDAIIAAGLALYVARHQRPAFVAFAALGAMPLALLAWYSWAFWGTPLALGQGQGLSGFTAAEPLVAAVGLLASPNRGLLVFSPIFIFSALFALRLVRRREGPRLLHYLIWSSVALIGLYTLWGNWAGGHTYGYRFLIELTPGLMLILAWAWPTLIEPRPWMRGLFLVAMLSSIYVHGLGADASPCGFDTEPNNIDEHNERLWDIRDAEIVRCTRRELDAWRSGLAGSA